MEDSLTFFESVFSAIPPAFRQVDKELKQDKQKKQKNQSLFDIHEKANTKIKAEQKANREKSLAKIAELTEQHKLTKLTNEEVKMRDEEKLSEDEGEEKKRKYVNKNTVSATKMENKRV